MSLVTFIRHSQLKSPFDQYENLNYSQLSQLASGAIDPGINEQTDLLLESSKIITFQYEIIFHSSSTRSLETAKAIAKHNKKKCTLQNLPSLSEITFSIETFMTESEHEQYGIQSVRDKLFSEIGKKNASIENLESIYNRLKNIEKTLTQYKSKEILVVTHGFFMRYIYYYFNSPILDRPSAQKLQDIVQSKNDRYDYLDGYTLKI